MPWISALLKALGGASCRRRAAQVLARRGREPDVARQVHGVRDAARQIAAPDLRHGPDDVGQRHRREAERQQHQGPARDRRGARVHQQHAARQQHDAVQRDVALRQHEPEHVRVVRGGGRRHDHEEPEEAAEAQQQDGTCPGRAGPIARGRRRRGRPSAPRRRRAGRRRGRTRRRSTGTDRRRTASRWRAAGCRRCSSRARP